MPQATRSYFKVKEILDRLAAILLLLPLLPVIGLLALVVRLTSKGPGVYKQLRVGKQGQRFLMYKLRSMRVDAEAKTGPVWSNSACDPRVTPLGYWLRKLHLDELPQLFNVLRGEMSFIGPRPERPEFVKVLSEQIEGYCERLRIAPGITGLAQVNLPPDTDLDSVRRKLILDCEYLNQASFFLDVRIILCTMLRVLGVRGGRGVKWLGLQRTVELPHAAAPIGGDPTALPATPGSIANAQAVGTRAYPVETQSAKSLAGMNDTHVSDSRRTSRPSAVALPMTSEV